MHIQTEREPITMSWKEKFIKELSKSQINEANCGSVFLVKYIYASDFIHMKFYWEN